MRLLLIRHGQTPNNASGTIDSAIPGARLTALGHRQAEAVPAAVTSEQIAGIHVSRLVRTQLTAAPLAAARGIEPVVQPGLEEISCGDLELRSDAESVAAYRACYHAWARGDLSRRMPGAEDGNEFLARYAEALSRVADAHRDRTAAVVSHGAAIRVWTILATGEDADTLDERPLRNTGMVVLNGDPDNGWTLESWRSEPLGGELLTGDASHDVTADEDAEPEQADHPATASPATA